MSQPIKNKIVLAFSILLSIFLHLGEIYFLKNSSLWFSTEVLFEGKTVDWTVSMEKIDRNQILKETFEAPFFQDGHGMQKQTSLPAAPMSMDLSIEAIRVQMNENPLVLSSLIPSFPNHQLFSVEQTLRFPTLQETQFDFFEHLPKNLLLPALQEIVAHPSLPPPPVCAHLTPPVSLQRGSEISSPSKPCFKAASETSSWKEMTNLVSAAPLAPVPHLPKIPSLADLQIVSCSDAFDVELMFIEQKEEGYIFALTVIPQPDFQIPSLKQNYFFLIDRSNSIQSDRLSATKSAVRKAIEELDPQDHFNVMVFDQGIEKLSSKCLPVSPESLTKAYAFIDKIELGSFFSQADLYKPLFLTSPFSVKEDELYTAILMTDGESLSKKSSVHTLLNEWTKQNQGQVSLYAIGMNEDSQSAILETLCACNRGKMGTSSTNRGIKRKLLRLMKSIHAPMAKNLSCKAISLSSQGSIEILPQAAQAPHLFFNEPYVILGKTNSLDDFILFVQGHVNGKWLHIKKTISFLQAKKGTPSLKKQWALQNALHLYQQSLCEGNPQYLVEAQNLIHTHQLRVKFE